MVLLRILVGLTLGVQPIVFGSGRISHELPMRGSALLEEPSSGGRTAVPEVGDRTASAPQVFGLLEGTWIGRGTLFGRPAEFRMRWTRVLNERFARLEFHNAFVAEGSGPPTPVLSAIGFYPLEGSAPRNGRWFDSRGATVSLTITPADSALQVDWEGAGERGRTVYTVSRDGVSVVDSVLADGGFREFGRATYARTSSAATGEQDTDWIVAATRRFELRSDPRVGLHHFLIDWASADAGEWPPYAAPLAERETWRVLLDDEEIREWAGAVAAYDASRGRSLLFDAGLLAVRDWAAGVATREAIPAAERPLADAIEAVLPIYRRHWWPAHDAWNRAWIESVSPTLAAIEEDMVPRLESAYAGRWPAGRIPIDVVAYANPVGAYSTAGRVTISSVDGGNQMPQAVEMVFHESSHIDPLEGSLRAGLQDAFQATGGRAPDRFWHDMIFYTTGEIIRLVLAEHGQPAYKHYGEYGVYRRGERWSVELPALERHWRPFLESAPKEATDRRAALEALARQLLMDEDGSR